MKYELSAYADPTSEAQVFRLRAVAEFSPLDVNVAFLAQTGWNQSIDRLRFHVRSASPIEADSPPRWTVENRQFLDRAKPAISGAAETSEFYFVPSSVRKSVCTFVRQLRGPHLSTWA